MRYFIAFLTMIGLIVLVFVLFLHGGGTPKKALSPVTDYAGTNAVVQMTIDGPVIADQTHRALRITVGQKQTEMEIVNGYQNVIGKSAAYDNNKNAYTVFLHALDLAGYTKVRSTSQKDDRGVCPEGYRYIFEIIDGSKQIQRLWSTSCGSQGTFGGKTLLNSRLFKKQIPDYDKLTNGLGFGA